MLQINEIKIRKDLSEAEVFEIALKKAHVKKEDVLEWYIAKKSIDARKKEDVHYTYSIAIDVKDEKKYRRLERIKKLDMPTFSSPVTLPSRPVIVGCGPAGLFAALTVVQNGAKPIIIEQGQPVEERQKAIEAFRKTGKLNPASNVQFGEGGAGTFSDGKLTTGIHSPFCKKVLEEFVHFGAPKQILYLSKPHIGTDNLIRILQNMREYLITNGATFLFNTKVIDFEIHNQQITSLHTICNGTEKMIDTKYVILAIGHSSRDTFEKLYEKGITMEAKNFSLVIHFVCVLVERLCLLLVTPIPL